jgi:hypothetical protein
MATRGEKINVLIPEGLLRQVRQIIENDQNWISVQDFIRQAVFEKVDRIQKTRSK